MQILPELVMFTQVLFQINQLVTATLSMQVYQLEISDPLSISGTLTGTISGRPTTITFSDGSTRSVSDSFSTSGTLTGTISGQPTSNSYSRNAGLPTRKMSDPVSISGTHTGTISG